MFLNILTAVDGSAASHRALDEAVDLSRALNSKLTLIAVAPPPHYSAYAGMNPEKLSEEAGRWADGVLTKALERVPDDVLAHTVRREGHAGPEIVGELARGGYDLVVLGTRGRSRAQEGCSAASTRTCTSTRTSRSSLCRRRNEPGSDVRRSSPFTARTRSPATGSRRA